MCCHDSPIHRVMNLVVDMARTVVAFALFAFHVVGNPSYAFPPTPFPSSIVPLLFSRASHLFCLELHKCTNRVFHCLLNFILLFLSRFSLQFLCRWSWWCVQGGWLLGYICMNGCSVSALALYVASGS